MTKLFYWMGSRPLIPLLIFSAVFTCFWLMQFKKPLRLTWLKAVALSVAHVVIGVCAVSLFAFLEDPNGYSFGVQSLFGGVFFMPLVYWAWAKFTKRGYHEVFDIFAVCMIFTLMCARMNCLFSGCCIGKFIPGTDGLRWPTREAELVFYIVLLIIYAPKVHKQKTCGEIYPMYMMGYGLFRFVTETFRTGNTLFHLSHLWALIAFCIGAGFILEFQSKKGGRIR